MNINAKKFTAAVILGILFGAYIRHDYVRWNSLGREAFLVHQAHRFDVYMAGPRPASVTVVAAVLVVIGFVCTYEALIAAMVKIFGAGESDKSGT